jgi:hypothetical protein
MSTPALEYTKAILGGIFRYINCVQGLKSGNIYNLNGVIALLEPYTADLYQIVQFRQPY